MGNIRMRPETGALYFDFHIRGQRCREYTTLQDTPTHRRRMQRQLDRIEADIQRGQFNYRQYFPNSRNAAKFDPPGTVVAQRAAASAAGHPGVPVSAAPATPRFRDFAELWFAECQPQWRRSTRDTNRQILECHLLPYFGGRFLSDIKKADCLQFRAALMLKPGRSHNDQMAAKTVNGVMMMLGAIMAEASDRYGFVSPTAKIARLKQRRPEIKPFSLQEVHTLITRVREDYRWYLTVRAFSGMRTAEADGLKWKYVDFERRELLIRETRSKGRTEYTKTDASQREIAMSQQIHDALRAQEKLSRHHGEYVFCTRQGAPIDAKNFTNRVWYPLLRYLDLEKRRPYQLRHTSATLWLASGEQAEWVARQLGHANTEMLFTVYSRYIPNLTRRDGSAFQALLANTFGETADED